MRYEGRSVFAQSASERSNTYSGASLVVRVGVEKKGTSERCVSRASRGGAGALSGQRASVGMHLRVCICACICVLCCEFLQFSACVAASEGACVVLAAAGGLAPGVVPRET